MVTRKRRQWLPWMPHAFFVLAFVCGVCRYDSLMWMSVVGMIACLVEREWRKPRSQ